MNKNQRFLNNYSQSLLVAATPKTPTTAAKPAIIINVFRYFVIFLWLILPFFALSSPIDSINFDKIVKIQVYNLSFLGSYMMYMSQEGFTMYEHLGSQKWVRNRCKIKKVAKLCSSNKFIAAKKESNREDIRCHLVLYGKAGKMYHLFLDSGLYFYRDGEFYKNDKLYSFIRYRIAPRSANK